MGLEMRSGRPFRAAVSAAAEALLEPAALDGVRLVPEPAVHEVPRRAVVARRSRLLTAACGTVDLGAVLAAYALSGDVAQRLGRAQALSSRPGAAIWATSLAWLVVFGLYGLYDRPRLAAASEEARRLFHGVTVAVVAVVTITFLAKISVDRTWIGAVWLVALLCVGVARLGMRKVAHLLSARGVIGLRTLVIGVNEEARTIARTLSRQGWLGYRPAGFVDVSGSGFESVDGLPVLGPIDRLAGLIGQTDAGAVIVAATAVGTDRLATLHQTLQALDVEVRVSAGLPQVAASRVSVAALDGLAVLALRRNELSRSDATVKRVFDVLGAAILLLVTAPVMLATAIAVRLSSAGPVLFRQIRVGEGGRPFSIVKFRTMVQDAEARLLDLRERNQADGLLFKLLDDPRVTRVGRVLRRTGLDELPQLWNVLRGEMSLVGPRPPLPDETERYDEWIRGRLRVKPGITGLWQVNGRHELSFADYVRYDLFYVENWSLSLDLFIIAKTLPALLARRGAY